MRVYKIAEMNIAADVRYEYTERCMSGYLTDETDYELYVSVTDEMIEHERSLNLQIHGRTFDDGVCEAVAVLRVICDYIVRHGGFFLHCSCLRIDGEAVIFTAPAGTGKSTHAALWREYLGDRVEMINDDKPLVRERDGRFIIYGTPWNGKHGIGSNISAPIGAVFFLEQAKVNSAERVDSFTALSRLLRQTVLPTDRSEMSGLLDMLGRLIDSTPMFSLKCDISEEAFITAYSAFRNKN